MKTTKLIKRNSSIFRLIVLGFVCLSMNAGAQNYSIKERWNIKLDYSSYSPLGFKSSGSDKTTPSFQTEFNYGLLNFLEIGPYVGYGSFKANEISSTGSYIAIVKSNALFYGVNTNLHLLPFLVQRKNFRFDVYASGKLGGFYRLSEENMYPERGHEWDYGLYAGAAFYFGRHLGCFGEYGIGNYTNHRLGLSIKF